MLYFLIIFWSNIRFFEIFKWFLGTYIFLGFLAVLIAQNGGFHAVPTFRRHGRGSRVGRIYIYQCATVSF
jgi:hypothetical protein